MLDVFIGCNSCVTAIVEQVRDACTVRAFLMPSFQYVTVMLSGIKVSVLVC